MNRVQMKHVTITHMIGWIIGNINRFQIIGINYAINHDYPNTNADCVSNLGILVHCSWSNQGTRLGFSIYALMIPISSDAAADVNQKYYSNCLELLKQWFLMMQWKYIKSDRFSTYSLKIN